MLQEVTIKKNRPFQEFNLIIKKIEYSPINWRNSELSIWDSGPCMGRLYTNFVKGKKIKIVAES